MEAQLLTRRSFALASAALGMAAVSTLAGCAPEPQGGLRAAKDGETAVRAYLTCAACSAACPMEVSLQNGSIVRVNASATPLCATGYQWVRDHRDAEVSENKFPDATVGIEHFEEGDSLWFIGLDPTDQMSAHELAMLAQARSAGASIMLIGPCLAGASPFVKEYMPIAPGSEPVLMRALAATMLASDSLVAETARSFPEEYGAFASWAASSNSEDAAKATGLSTDALGSIAQHLCESPRSSHLFYVGPPDSPAASICNALMVLLNADSFGDKAGQALASGCVDAPAETLGNFAYRLARPGARGLSAAECATSAQDTGETDGMAAAVVSSATAKAMGLSDGDEVEIRSFGATGTFKVTSSDGIDDRCVYVPISSVSVDLAHGDIVSLKKVGA